MSQYNNEIQILTMNDDRGKYDQQLADEAEQQYLHECALRDIAQGIPGWDYIEEDTKL
jgi:hypothetical protein